MNKEINTLRESFEQEKQKEIEEINNPYTSISIFNNKDDILVALYNRKSVDIQKVFDIIHNDLDKNKTSKFYLQNTNDENVFKYISFDDPTNFFIIKCTNKYVINKNSLSFNNKNKNKNKK